MAASGRSSTILASSARFSGGPLLRRLLDDPGLVAGVQALEPRVLARLVDRVGLEDAGEIVALATTEQLSAVLDEDLWRAARPGAEERLDPARFALWLEVLLEAGESFAARRIAELDEDLVTTALHQLVLVVDMDRLAMDMAGREEDDDATLLDKALESTPHEELGQYRVIARRHHGWDAVVAILVALDGEHHDLVERLLERLAHASAEVIDDGGGLHQVLSAAEELAGDAAAARDDRRAAEGYVAASDAASFLALARGPIGEAELAPGAPPDPITRAYFREWRPRPRTPPGPGRGDGAPGEAAPGEAARSGTARSGTARGVPGADGARLVEVLREAGVVEGARPLLRQGAEVRGAAFRAALAGLAAASPDRHQRILAELHYLANVLVAGCPLAGRRFRPLEAAEAAIAACNLGLEERPTASLAGTGAVALFRLGWHVLHRDVVQPARAARLASADPEVRRALTGLAGDCPTLTGALATGRVFLAGPADVGAARGFLGLG
jgi:hypothetical protein